MTSYPRGSARGEGDDPEEWFAIDSTMRKLALVRHGASGASADA
jgi:hypothetical protein